ncbi:MAG TPA: type I restriction enzyme HsdR N-terminal domain-containing protein [Bacteroidales bacterium]|jgi:hypothetical protein|nr:type I restriction enzyme HsdR N-terminal domain-containing protein [Bacteroidales bacterium]HPE40375.1 type I restriction enzyme HsdR N-terminal domain-containing protein [Bacteroidales bacterium]
MTKVREINGKTEIFDPIRKKWVVLTDEEKVRQYCIQRLIQKHGFSPALIGIEKQLIVNGMSKRYDIVVFNNEGQPLLVIECKASHVKIDQSVVEQVGRYNKTLQADIVGVTNGHQSYFFKVDFNTEQIVTLNFDF